jgi:selenide,water dikinase
VKIAPAVNVMEAFKLLPDPQTNGGIMMAVHPDALSTVQQLLAEEGLADFTAPIGVFVPPAEKTVVVE